MKNFWDIRYSDKAFVYGKEPNLFFKKQIDNLPVGNILLPAEGEGRNAVYAAKLGWNVIAFDGSNVGKEKALVLAKDNDVIIDYIVSSFEDFEYTKNYFDCISLIFAHVDPLLRNKYHTKLLDYLKPGGRLILEGFSKKQLDLKTGGPKNIDMLFSDKEIKNDFDSLKLKYLAEEEVLLREGEEHKGLASVIRFIGVKKN